MIGSLKTWDVTPILSNIKVPTLVINAEFDEARSVCVAPFFNKIPQVKWYCFSNASHMAHVEKTDEYMEVLMDFLTTTEVQ